MPASSNSDIFDRLPPQNLDAERAVLGSMLLSHEAIDEVADILHPRHFYGDAHRRVAEAIFRLAENSLGGIDVVTVAEDLETHKQLEEVGGPVVLSQILEAVPHAGNARYYAQIVRDKFVQRSLRDACTGILRDIHDESADTDELLSHAEERVFQILEQQGEADKLGIRDILMNAFDGIHARMELGGGVSGVSTGFSRLDDLTSGLHPQSLIIIAARPSMGKTAFVCNICKNVALNARKAHDMLDNPSPDDRPQGVVLFSLEQSKLEIAERLLCMLAKFDGHKLRKGEINPEEHDLLLRTADELGRLPIYIDDQPGRSMAQISAVCRRLKRRHGLGLIIIDYLQLIEPEDKKAPREQQVAQIARRLKFLAKEINVPVIALAQLNRGVDLRVDKQPKLADLRESGAIEQDADLVMFLHRPDAYDPTDRPGEADLIVAKNRNGPTGIVHLTWLKESLRFGELSRATPAGGVYEDGGGF